MRRIIYSAVLLSLYWECLATPTHPSEQFIYSYNAKVTARSSISSEIVSQWTLFGNLTIEPLYRDAIIMRLDQLKTTTFNGPKNELDKIHEMEIPEEANILTKPFVISFNSEEQTIFHLPDEPLWSVNMKRAIASIFLIKMDNLYQEGTFSLPEKNIYGNCKVNYNVKNIEGGKIVDKIIDHSECKNKPFTGWANVLKPTINSDYETIISNTSRVFTIKAKNRTSVITRLEAISKTTYRTMPSDSKYHHVHQIQVFELLTHSKNTNPIDISRNTVIKNITFEFGENNLNRHKVEESGLENNSSLLLKSWEKFSKCFQKDINKDFVTNIDLWTNHTVDELHWTLSKMDKATLGKIRNQDKDSILLLMSLLPYIGSNATVQFLKDLSQNNLVNKVLLLRALATLPIYVSEPSEELLANMKVLMNLRDVSPEIKNAGILSFASLVANAYYRGSCRESLFKQYVEKYFKLYHDAKDYEQKFIYLLGLINLGENEKLDIATEIILKKDEFGEYHKSHHIKSLAIYAYNHQIKNDANEVYQNFWPIVRNESEHFEVRVAALDLLLSSQLKEEQFTSMLKTYHTYPTDIYEQHLYNYFYTTLQSLQNTTGYSDNLNDLATSSMKYMKRPTSSRGWVTGNYRMSYTDDVPNFGFLFQTRLVGTPTSNIINVIQLTYNRFALSTDLGRYTVYLKLEGVNDRMLLQTLFADYVTNKDGLSIPELVEILKTHMYKLKKERDMHVEFVIFCDNRVMFGLHLNANNIYDFPETDVILHLQELMQKSTFVSFPVISQTDFVSDLGTLLTVRNDHAQIWSHNIGTSSKSTQKEVNGKLRFQYQYYFDTQFETYNPVSDVTLGSTRRYNNEKLLVFPFIYNFSTPFRRSWTWDNNNDILSVVTDEIVGTYVDNESVLKQYCPYCYSRFAVVEINNASEKLEQEKLGLSFNVSVSNCTLRDMKDTFTEATKSHRSNYYAIPPAKMYLLVTHYLDRALYLSPFDSCSISLRSLPYTESSQSALKFNMDADVIYKDNDPYEGHNISMNFAFTNKRKSDGHFLRHWNVALKLHIEPKTLDEDSRLKIDHNYALHIDNIYSDGTKAKFCLDHEILYPSRRLDKFFPDPVAPATGQTIMSWGSHDLNPDTCPTEQTSIIITELYSVSEEQKDYVNKMEDLETCKKYSAGLKFTPPIESCMNVFQILSKYRNYQKTFKFNSLTEESYAYLQALNYWLHIHENKIPSSDLFTENALNLSLRYEIEDTSLDIIMNDKEIAVDNNMIQHFLEFLLINPNSEAYDEYKVDIGLKSTCIITPKNVKTFLGKNVRRQESELNKDFVGFVDCLDNNNTHNGLTFQLLSDTQLSFKLWSKNNVLTATPENGKLKVLLNGKERTKDNFVRDMEFNVHFLDTDVIYITSPMVQIYYNTEYISIMTYSLYNEYVCGLCNEATNFH